MSGVAEPFLADALAAAAAQLAPERVERAWIFAPRRVPAGESGVVVFAAYPSGEEQERREVLTLRYEVEPGVRGQLRRHDLVSEGSIPQGRVSGLIAGVVRRLGEASEPRQVEVSGDPSRWEALLLELRTGAAPAS